MADTFFVHDTNPNDTRGGGGCLAAGLKASEDCGGKWIHFHRSGLDSDLSPYAVICERHLNEVIAKYPAEDPLAGGDELPIRQHRELDERRLEPMGAVPHVKL